MWCVLLRGVVYSYCIQAVRFWSPMRMLLQPRGRITSQALALRWYDPVICMAALRNAPSCSIATLDRVGGVHDPCYSIRSKHFVRTSSIAAS